MLPLVNVHVALSIGLSVVTVGNVFDVWCALVVLCLITRIMKRIWFNRSRASVKRQNGVGSFKKGYELLSAGFTADRVVSKCCTAQYTAYFCICMWSSVFCLNFFARGQSIRIIEWFEFGLGLESSSKFENETMPRLTFSWKHCPVTED